MMRDRAFAITIVALLAVSLACNAFAGSLEPFPPPPTEQATEQGASTTAGTPPATLQPALSPVKNARLVVLLDLNVRSGPGVEYDRVGFLLKDETVPVIGVHKPTGWWKIDCPEVANGRECWVSGGEQYTQAEDVDGVEIVAAPSTPTPIPPALEEGQGVLAYSDGGIPYAAKVDLTEQLPLFSSEPVQLADAVEVETLSIAPDGRRIAFLAVTTDANALYVVNIEGEDLRLLADAAELPLGSQGRTGFRLLIDEIAWLPDGTAVAFNTVALNRSGPGVLSQEDLWMVDLDGNLSPLLPAGEGGGAFLFTANNQVLLSQADNVSRAAIDGSNRQPVVEFPRINTASEYVYYPLPQQLNLAEAHLFVPAAEPWEAGAWSTLWEIPPAGPARQLGSVAGALLFDRLVWSPDGSRLAFVERTTDEDGAAISRLMIADGKGINANAYAGGDNVVVHGWSMQGESLLYAGEGFYAVGRVNGPPLQTLLEPGQQLGRAKWVGDETYIAALGSAADNVWQLFSSDLSGETISLTTMHGDEPLFEIWMP